MSASYEMDCPYCGKHLMQKDEAGTVHLLTRLTSFTKDGRAMGKCPGCKKKVPIPVRLAPTMRHLVANP